MNKLAIFGALVLVLTLAACSAPADQQPAPDDQLGDQTAPSGETNPAGAEQSFQCPDGTVVDDPAECPSQQ